MKQTFKLSAIVAALLLSASAFATDPSATGAGNIAIGSNINGTFNVNQSGWSASQAGNSQSANAVVMSGVTKTPSYDHVTAQTAGATATKSDAYAINQSANGGTGFAQSTGSTSAATSGTANIHGIASAAGASNAGTTDHVASTTNQGGENASQTSSTFGAALDYTTSHSTATAPGGGSVTNGVGLASNITGTANGSNQTWNGHELNISGINDAGVNQVNSTGAFSGSATGAASVASSAAFVIPTIQIGPFTIPTGPAALSLH